MTAALPEWAERFLAKVDQREPDECWPWKGPLWNGYGSFQHSGISMKAHRWSFKIFKADPIPGQPIDHICRNRACVNPSHLRQVDHKTNILENSVAVTAINAAKTHCSRGHDLANTPRKIKSDGTSVERYCAACQAIHNRNHLVRTKATLQAAISQNDAMRQELTHVGNLVSDLAKAMGVDQANEDGSWPDLSGRLGKLIETALQNDGGEG